jgi:MoxR-like ATPase
MKTKGREKKAPLEDVMDLKDFVSYVGAFSVYAERESELRQIILALLSKEHVLLKGLPGTAKSELSLKVLSGISGAKIFRQQFTAFMDESYVFGPMIIEELKKGKVIHNIKDSLVDCDFAFLDEFFNANEETIISCNEILNERTFTRNYQREKSPLITAILTTNQERESEKKLKPIYDRLMFTSNVLRVAQSRLGMYRNAIDGRLDVKAAYSMDKLRNLHSIIESAPMIFSDALLEAFDSLLKNYQEQANEYISDRKAIRSLTVLKIIALMRFSSEVSLDDLKELRYVWIVGNNAAQLSVFDACYMKIKQEFALIENEVEKIAEVKTSLEELEDSIKKAKGYADYKEIKTVAQAAITTSEGIQTTTAERDNILRAYTHKLQSILETAKEEMKKFQKSGSSNEVEQEDFDWFKGLSKDQIIKRPKASAAEDILEG